MSKPPGGKRSSILPPTSASPFVSVVHQPARPSMVVRAASTSSVDDEMTPTR
jgi:hypothetical protein